ncbi:MULTISPECIES: hypothetical protein [unclassified Parabacteroides]|uniref:hypothetical protein n=1 Tax=unclassified Parabacteroides TaxID=2649774 RepID=UPI0024747C92|nr:MULTISPECIES: hypothetical protein [unclassified Parabacteroides]
MKKNVFSLLSIALLVFSSCTSDEYLTGGHILQTEKITFSFPGVVAEESADIPLTQSHEVVLNKLVIYMFDNLSGLLEKIFYDSHISLDNTPSSCQVQIEPGSMHGDKTFYFVGNNNDDSSPLSKAQAGISQLDGFISTLSSNLTDLKPQALLLSGKISTKEMNALNKPVQVNLKCRMARFDVDKSSVDDFKIKKIKVENALNRTYIFTDAPHIWAEGLEYNTYYLENFEHYGAFYLYPAILGEGKTIISFEGTINGKEKSYRVNFDKDIYIQGDNYYTLKPSTLIADNSSMEMSISERGNRQNSITEWIWITPWKIIDSNIIL